MNHATIFFFKRWSYKPCYVLKSWLFIFLFCLSSSHAQSQELDTALQANETRYPFDMKYYGSEFRVDPNYTYSLNEMAEWIKNDSTVHLHIRGHVCCGPSKRLSKRRARKVYRYFILAGVPKERLSWKGYSDTCPAQWPEKTDQDEAANRRVDFVIRTIK